MFGNYYLTCSIRTLTPNHESIIPHTHTHNPIQLSTPHLVHTSRSHDSVQWDRIKHLSQLNALMKNSSYCKQNPTLSSLSQVQTWHWNTKKKLLWKKLPLHEPERMTHQTKLLHFQERKDNKHKSTRSLSPQ